MIAEISGRAKKVLQRFPRHMEAEAAGKLLGSVTHALVRDQDVQAADMQRIRLAHRLFDAKELRDLLLLGAMHGIRRSELTLLFDRYSRVCELLKELSSNVESEGDLADRESLAVELLSNWSLPGVEPLRLFASDPESEDPLDVAEAVTNLLPVARAACRSRILLEGVRRRIAEIAAIHVIGNGTIKALLLGAANSLDLNLGTIEHSEDRYWHAGPVYDRIKLGQLTPKTEYMGIEENPRILAERGPRPCKHTELFHYLRKGFDDALLEVKVIGIGNRTFGPMVVNRDEGHGVGFFGQVPDGNELVFSQGGRVMLDGEDVTSRSYSWQGACFAEGGAEVLAESDSESKYRNDFVFVDGDFSMEDIENNDRSSYFVQVTPFDALDREALLPHAGDSLPMPSIGIGKTRFAFFVQYGHFSTLKPDHLPLPDGIFGSDPFGSTPDEVRDNRELVVPRHGLGVVDASVFADETLLKDASEAIANSEVSGKVHLSWFERQAYKVKLLIPQRFQSFDEVEGASVKEQVKNSLRRFRPAGIDVVVDFVEENWLLGDAELPQENESMVSAISRIQSQTVLEAIPEGE